MPSSYHTTSGRVRWKANWRDANGAQHSKNFDDAGAAAAYEHRMVAEREASLGPQVCAREGCNEIVVQDLSAGAGRRRLYHSDECSRAAWGAMRVRHPRQAPELPAPTPCKNPDCDQMVVQTGIGARKKFHSVECGRDYWNKTRRPEFSTRRHVTDVDESIRMGTCSFHGAVTVYRVNDRLPDGRPRVRWICKLCNIERSVESRARYTASSKGRRAKLANRLGITREQLDAALATATGQCHICGQPGTPSVLRDESSDDLSLVYDHCHDNGPFRGWLCDRHNLALGLCDDDPATLRRAAEYLERHATTVVGP